MEHLKKGDIVFSAEQTEDLLKAGKTSNYARALADGTLGALTNGTVHAYGYGGFGSNPWSSSGSGSSGSSSNNIGTGSSSGGGSNTKSKADKDKIDWIEIAIKRFNSLISKLTNVAENLFNNLIHRLDATNENIIATRRDIEFQGKAYDRYMKEANSVGLNENIAEKVRNGDIDINSYDDKTKTQIQEYQKWYEKALACSEAVEELKNSLGELYKSKFDATQKSFEDRLELMKEKASSFDFEIQELEKRGYTINSGIYESQKKENKNRIAVLTSQLAEMQKAFDDTVASGSLEEGSEAWYEMMLEIQKVKNAISETEIEILELDNSIRELHWDSFDKALERISDINTESDFLIELLSRNHLMDDNGSFTDSGMAVLGLHAQNIDTYLAKSREYADEIARIDKDIAKDPLNQNLINRRKELLSLQRESILAANSEKDAMKDLVEEGIDAQLDAMKELIDAYSDSLDSAKDLYDYQNEISEKSDSIANIEKQLAAYQGDDSEETRAKVQKLNTNLEKAQQDLKDTEYDRFVSDTKEMLDNFYEDYEEALNSRLDDTDSLVDELIGSVNANSNSILTTLEEATANAGISLSKEISDIWTNSGSAWNVISTNGDKVANRISSVFEVVKAIYQNTCIMSNQNGGLSFASGGLVDYTGTANVHGTKTKPELMLNADDTKNFLALRDALRNMPNIDLVPHMINFDKSALTSKFSASPVAVNEPSVSFGDTIIEIDHVDDYNDFVQKLRDDNKFENYIQEITLGRLAGKSSLRKNSYSWKR